MSIFLGLEKSNVDDLESAFTPHQSEPGRDSLPSIVPDTLCLELGMESLLVLSHLLQFATLSPGNVSTSFQEAFILLEEGRRDRRQDE